MSTKLRSLAIALSGLGMLLAGALSMGCPPGADITYGRACTLDDPASCGASYVCNPDSLTCDNPPSSGDGDGDGAGDGDGDGTGDGDGDSAGGCDPMACVDALFCNGQESCDGDVCRDGPDPCGGATPVCDEETDTCRACTVDSDCENDKFCDGADRCVDGICVHDGDPCLSDGLNCNEGTDSCAPCVTNADCDDEIACTGVDTCNGGVCTKSASPCAAPNDLCDTENDRCVQCFGQGDCETGFCLDFLCVECLQESDCPAGELCTSNACTNCDDDTECGSGRLCIGGACIEGDCRTRDDCLYGRLCEDHGCVPCVNDDECASDELCIDGGCLVGNCRTVDECAPEQACVAYSCAACSDDEQCGANEICLGGACRDGAIFGGGEDGIGVVLSGTVDLSTTSISGRATPDMPTFRVTNVATNGVVVSVAPGANLAVGDEVLLITLRGARANQNTWYVDNVGNYEAFKVASTSGTTVTFDREVARTYGHLANGDVTASTVALVRVPHYSSLTIADGATLTGPRFQPALRPGTNTLSDPLGGSLVLRVSGPLTVATGGRITMSGLGYRGGPFGSSWTRDGQQGEGRAGFGTQGVQGGNYNANSGAQCNVDGVGLCVDNAGGGGALIVGAGGGHGTAGETAGGWNPSIGIVNGPEGGQPYGDTQLSQVFMGGGGGGIFWGFDEFNPCQQSQDGDKLGPAGNGGGIVALFVRQAVISGTVDADGAPGLYKSYGGHSYGTGGGAGGSVWLSSEAVVLGPSSTIRAAGGAGLTPSPLCGNGSYNPVYGIKGGDGGQGRIRLDAVTVNGGAPASAAASIGAAFAPEPGYVGTP